MMDPKRLEELLNCVANGHTTIEEALFDLRTLPFQDLGSAKPDTHRALRQGVPETIFCQGKAAEQVVRISETLLAAHGSVLATRCNVEQWYALRVYFSNAVYHEQARLAIVGKTPLEDGERKAFQTFVICAGTSDLSVAEESALILEHLGFTVNRIYDAGVAGLHRLLSEMKSFQEASAIIAVAGMDGAMPSVVGGLVACPVVAVPTSVGYGASFGGIAPLLTMLNSCAHGITVVNIDNGFGAAMAVNRIFLSSNPAQRRPLVTSTKGERQP